MAITDFTYPSSNGVNTIHARISVPEGKPKGIVQIAHGITEHIGVYDRFMDFLAENGYVTVGNDHLGHGRSYTDPDDCGFFAESNGWNCAAADIRRLNKIVKAKFPDIPLVYFGFSMGSFLVRTCLIKYPDSCDAAIICGTGHQRSAAVNTGFNAADNIVKQKGARADGKTISALTFLPYGRRLEKGESHACWITSDHEEMQRFADDPLCGFTPKASMFRDMFGGIIYVSNPKNLQRMNKELPVLFMSGSDDPVGGYGKGVMRAFESFVGAGMKNTAVKLYGGKRHHLICETNREEVMQDILTFLENNSVHGRSE